MKFPFGPLPQGSSTLRPLVLVRFEGLDGVEVPALLDSGAVRNRFSAQYAEQLGLDISQGAVEPFKIAGQSHLAHLLTVPLLVGRWRLQTLVGFVQDWPHGHGVLGLQGFFDHFSVRIEAAASYSALTKR